MTPYRVGRVVAGALLLVAVGSHSAWAHVEPTVDRYPAGSTGTLTLGVEHGCQGSPTVKMAIRLPAGVTSPVPVPRKGWTASVSPDRREVIWRGGSLPAAVHAKFSVRLTFPRTPGAKLTLPVVQTCKVGVNRWVGLSEDDDYPAPTITLT